MLQEFLEKHQTVKQILLGILGLIFLYYTISFGLLGLLTGKTELISKFHQNTQVTTPLLAFLVSLFTLIIGGYLTFVIFSTLWAEKLKEKLLKNKLLQIIFISAILGYIILLFYFWFQSAY